MVHPHPFDRWYQETAGQDHSRSTPWVTIAYAQSLDGSITTTRGLTLGLSSPESLRVTHQVRSAHDAILVGIGTVLADDPRLTAREVEGAQPQPVILDSYLRTPEAARVLAHPKPPWIAALSGAPENLRRRLLAKKARLIEFEPDPLNLIPLNLLLAELGQRGVRRLMVEGGTKVISQFLKQNLVDSVFITIAPVYVGGLPVLDGQVKRKLHDTVVDRCGEDILVWGKVT